MYASPHAICVAGLVFQSDPADASFVPGCACGIPYAPLLWLYALTRQLLSRVQMLSRHMNCEPPQPRAVAIESPIARAEPGLTATKRTCSNAAALARAALWAALRSA